jgi:hypothetical protein
MGLRSEVIYLVRSHRFDERYHSRTVAEVTVMKKEPVIDNRFVSNQVIDSGGVRCRRAPHNSMDLIAFPQ